MTTPGTVPQRAEIRAEDLPAWMRPRQRNIDHGLLIVLGLCLALAAPLLARPGLPRDTDLELYEWRSAQVAALVRAGVLYSRWAPDWMYGYGSPVLNYIAPLPHYLAGFHQAVTESSPVDSVKLLLIGSFLLAGTGMYLFARTRWGLPAGVLSAALYLTSGPIAVSLPYIFGDLAALMALGLLPWAAWSLDQLWLHADRRAWAVALGALLAFSLCDTRITFLGAAALAVVIDSGRRLPGVREQTSHQGARAVLAVLVAVVGITAFFWAPALADTSEISWSAGRELAFAGAIPLTESLGGLPIADVRLLNPTAYRGLGVAPWGMALAGLAVLLARRVSPGDRFALLALGVALVLLASPWAAGLWPAGAAYQFQPVVPYHAILVAAFCLAGAGSAAADVEKLLPRPWSGAALPVVCGLALVAALPAAYPPPWTARQGETTTLDSLQAELQGFHLASLRHGVVLPASAPTAPQPLPNALEVFGVDQPDRVNRRSLPAEAQMDTLDQGPLHSTYIVNTQEPATVTLNTLYALGWYARIGDLPAPIAPSADGFISVALPAFNGELTVWYGGAPSRDLGWLITVLGAVFAALVWRSLSRTREHTEGAPHSLGVARLVTLVTLAMMAFAFVLWVQGRPDALPGATLSENAHALPRFLQGGVDLLGYEAAETVAAPGETLRLVVYWQAGRAIGENDQSETRIVDPATRQVVAREAHRHPGNVPTLRWPLGKIVRDEFVVTLPPGTLPGEYLLQVAVGRCQTRDPLPCQTMQDMDAYDAAGGVERGAVTIPVVVRVRAPQTPE